MSIAGSWGTIVTLSAWLDLGVGNSVGVVGLLVVVFEPAFWAVVGVGSVVLIGARVEGMVSAAGISVGVEVANRAGLGVDAEAMIIGSSVAGKGSVVGVGAGVARRAEDGVASAPQAISNIIEETDIKYLADRRIAGL